MKRLTLVAVMMIVVLPSLGCRSCGSLWNRRGARCGTTMVPARVYVPQAVQTVPMATTICPPPATTYNPTGCAPTTQYVAPPTYAPQVYDQGYCPPGSTVDPYISAPAQSQVIGDRVVSPTDPAIQLEAIPGSEG
ncbi:MAG: hypothetical protein R3E01_16145 [Pirellulaceae bacterium]|nr:hypothetical protein [Planctomycetales bacterium]